MGAWGFGLLESDDGYDYLDNLGDFFPNRELYKIINNEISEKELNKVKKTFEKNKNRLREIAINGYDSSIYILIYIGFLKFFGIDLDKTDMEYFYYAYNEETNTLEIWSSPEERKNVLDTLKEAVEKNQKYDFNLKPEFPNIILDIKQKNR